jgi:hypothetical protein
MDRLTKLHWRMLRIYNTCCDRQSWQKWDKLYRKWQEWCLRQGLLVRLH